MTDETANIKITRNSPEGNAMAEELAGYTVGGGASRSTELLALADELQRIHNVEARAGLAFKCADNIGTIISALRLAASPAAGMREALRIAELHRVLREVRRALDPECDPTALSFRVLLSQVNAALQGVQPPAVTHCNFCGEEIDGQPARPAPQGERESIAGAIRDYCRGKSATAIQVSSDGLERIYWVGLPLLELADAILSRVPAGGGERCRCGVTCQNLGRENGCRYARPELAQLRRLVDIVWQHATESTAVPSTDTSDELIDRALTDSSGAVGVQR